MLQFGPQPRVPKNIASGERAPDLRGLALGRPCACRSGAPPDKPLTFDTRNARLYTPPTL